MAHFIPIPQQSLAVTDLTCSETMDELSTSNEKRYGGSSPLTTPNKHPGYHEDQLAALLAAEPTCLAHPQYLTDVQGDQVKEWMRDLVVQWVLETGEDFRLHSETIAMAVNIFDRFLSQKVVSKQYLQLVATAAILISSKSLEVAVPALDDLQASSRNAFSIEEIKTMELEVLDTLGWSVSGVTSHTLLRTILATFPQDIREQVHSDAGFFVDLSFCAYSFLQWAPSTLASAAIMCSFRKSAFNEAPCIEHLRSRGIDMQAVEECQYAVLELFSKLFPDEPGLVPRDGSPSFILGN